MASNRSGPNKGVRIGRSKRERVIERWAGRCWICAARPPRPTMDHVLERRDGGTVDEDNLRPACGRCNRLRARAIAGAPAARLELLRRRVLAAPIFAREGLPRW